MSSLFVIAGYSNCGYHARAIRVAEELKRTNNNIDVQVITQPRPQFLQSLSIWKAALGPRAQSHKTSPIIWQEIDNQKKYIGGYDDFVVWVEHSFQLPNKIKF